MLHSVATCYTLLHLPKSSLTSISKTISGIAGLLMTNVLRLVCFVEGEMRCSSQGLEETPEPGQGKRQILKKTKQQDLRLKEGERQ